MSELLAAAPDSVARHLLPSEQCVVAVRRHPARLIRPAALAVGLLCALGLLAAVVPADTPYTVDAESAVLIALMLWIAWRLAEWRAEYFVITDRRILLATGLLTRQIRMMPLSKVTDMRYDKPIAGRIFDYGVFVLESAGQDDVLREVGYIPTPDAIYLELCDLLFGPDDEEYEEYGD